VRYLAFKKRATNCNLPRPFFGYSEFFLKYFQAALALPHSSVRTLRVMLVGIYGRREKRQTPERFLLAAPDVSNEKKQPLV
jgi:hypothetical protein